MGLVKSLLKHEKQKVAGGISTFVVRGKIAYDGKEYSIMYNTRTHDCLVEDEDAPHSLVNWLEDNRFDGSSTSIMNSSTSIMGLVKSLLKHKKPKVAGGIPPFLIQDKIEYHGKEYSLIYKTSTNQCFFEDRGAPHRLLDFLRVPRAGP